MKQQGISIKRWSWLALFGFAWMQLGLIAHLSLVAHDIDARGHTVHSHQVRNSSTHAAKHYTDASRSSSKSDKRAPIANEDCQVLHFIEHSSGLFFASSPMLVLHVSQTIAKTNLLLSPSRYNRQLYRLSPAQSPPQKMRS